MAENSPNANVNDHGKRFLGRCQMEPGDTTATVKLYLEISVGEWGPECLIAQAVKQACDEAENKLRKLFRDQRDINVIHVQCVDVKCAASKAK